MGGGENDLCLASLIIGEIFILAMVGTLGKIISTQSLNIECRKYLFLAIILMLDYEIISTYDRNMKKNDL